MEKAFDFRTRLQIVHKPHRYNPAIAQSKKGVWIDRTWQIILPADAGIVLTNAAKDLADYFLVSMGLDVAQPRQITVQEQDKLVAGDPLPKRIYLTSAGETCREGEFYVYRLNIASAIIVTATNERAAAKACFRLEEKMNLNEGPVLDQGDFRESILFSPRSVSTTLGDGFYPDQYLALIAHYGFDAIGIGTGGVLEDPERRKSVNDLITRAAAWGLDAYTVNPFKNNKHPDDDGALAYYRSRQGELFRACPGLKGIKFIGESCEFPSKDPRTTGKPWRESLQDSKPSPGWFPCSDFPDFMKMMCTVIHEVNPDADVILWTYNWGFENEDLRISMIENLPPECVLMATFEMFEQFHIKENVTEVCTDYTLYFPGPGTYFSSEGAAAKRLGLKFHSMTNTAGNTWDIGGAPALPAPQQWLKRWQAVKDAHDRYGLSGLRETLSYGFYPGFLPELALSVFRGPGENFDKLMRAIAVRDYSEQTADLVLEAWRLYSEGMTHCIPTNEDQYGPCRIGPSYPLFFERHEAIPKHSGSKKHPNRICNPVYRYNLDLQDKLVFETEEYAKMAQRFAAGSALLQQAIDQIEDHKKEEAKRMLGIARFIERTARTTVHVKRWHLLKGRLGIYVDTEAIWVGGRKNMPDAAKAVKPLVKDPDPEKILLELVDIAEAEIANAEATFPLVMEDSRLGFEAEFDYGCSVEQLQWKIDVTRRALLEEVLPRLKAVQTTNATKQS
ncbi:MAG: hypothetical protein GX173_08250 [Ruminococcaceae bacterium]|nr:hypothetical protein [Oscillospiraceae bacterium]